jgi:hypothetical protein
MLWRSQAQRISQHCSLFASPGQESPHAVMQFSGGEAQMEQAALQPVFEPRRHCAINRFLGEARSER